MAAFSGSTAQILISGYFILELLRHKRVRRSFSDLFRPADTFLDTFADIAVVVNEQHLRAVMGDELSAFLAHGIGHDDDRSVSFDRADEGESDSLISARGLHDESPFSDQALRFRRFHHRKGGSCLDRAAHV